MFDVSSRDSGELIWHQENEVKMLTFCLLVATLLSSVFLSAAECQSIGVTVGEWRSMNSNQAGLQYYNP